MPIIDLPQGSLEYRIAGPAEATAPPVVFVHGFLVDGTLWKGTAEALATDGIRSYAPDWPLASHRIPIPATSDLPPRGVARVVVSVLETLDLPDVTLGGNDSGGAITQRGLDTDASRWGRVGTTHGLASRRFPRPPSC